MAASELLNQKSAMPLWSKSADSKPFGGGTLLLGPPIRRTVLLNTAGRVEGSDCSGELQFDWNGYFDGNPPDVAPGQFVFGQYWVRDPALAGATYLTRGIRYLLQP
jgi:hypothetical protein